MAMDEVHYNIQTIQLKNPISKPGPIVAYCQECKKPIMSDEEFYEFDDHEVCQDCLDNYILKQRRVLYES